MRITTERLVLTKRYPLTISRGTIRGSTNVIITIEHDGVVGMGEAAPNDVSGDSTDSIEAAVARWRDPLAALTPWDREAVAMVAGPGPADGAARAGLDFALHDWWGRRLGHPLYRLWGLDRFRVPHTSVTIGMAAPDLLAERVPEILARTGARALKVKLGGAGGVEEDREMFATVQAAAAGAVTGSVSGSAAGAAIRLRVDANGGWDPDQAIEMASWLAGRSVDYVEQPLPPSLDGELAAVVTRLALPVYLDESVTDSVAIARVARLEAGVAGVNLKLMKSGGLAEAARMIAVARAHGLSVMLGCMGESALAITAAAHLSPLVDETDLDSHLNLTDDPFVGAQMIEGRIVAPDRPGIGVVRAATAADDVSPPAGDTGPRR